MLKRMFSKKIIISTAVLFSLFLMSLVPNENLYSLDDIPYNVTYVSKEESTSVIYLLDKNNMVARTHVVTKETDTIKLAKELLTILTGGEGNDRLPSGFRAIIPSETKILSIGFEEGLLKIDFSNELLEVEEDMEERLIEAITYTLTSIDNVDNIIIYVDGNILTKLPKSKINLPSTLNRKFGINKQYDLQSFNDIEDVTIYYINKYNDEFYYVPVTKYLNSDKDKIKIIVDELASGPTYGNDLMSFLNSNTKLLATEQDIDTLFLVFNEYIFSDMETNNILEEVLYTIELSIKDNYNIENVVFEVNDKEIYKSALKTLE